MTIYNPDETDLVVCTKKRKRPKKYKGQPSNLNQLMGDKSGELVFRSARQSTGYFVPYYYEPEFDVWHGYTCRFGHEYFEKLDYTTRDGSNPIWWNAPDIQPYFVPYEHKAARKLRYVIYALEAGIPVGSVGTQRKRYLAGKNSPPPIKNDFLSEDEEDDGHYYNFGA